MRSLGRFLAPRLRAEGYEVVGLDVAPGPDTQVLGSIADRALVNRVFAEHGPDRVVHAGALHKPDIVRYPNQAAWDNNTCVNLSAGCAVNLTRNNHTVYDLANISVYGQDTITHGRE